jgi:hypothetical protein
MNLGKWTPWKPLREMSGEYCIISYVSSFYGLKIILSKYEPENNTEIHIRLGNAGQIFRVINETYRGRLWRYLSETHHDVDMSGPLFIVEDSEYLRFLSEESENITDALNYKHYYIRDSEWSFDIASQQQPRVELFVDGVSVEVSDYKWHYKKES